ncbi:hydrogenase maturation nickel metallochaperone HypA [Marinobacterium aestuariivivens]|uniref:Hydrogenase maturation factor HypA n=1 Tax=Marinobacterium aestuariivivens TaxID=1698799 RepID=A0ABW2A240_9GAMM
MHELSLCRSLCRSLEEEVRQRGLNRVLRVELAVGSLSCVEPGALQFAFEAIGKPACLEGCTLGIHRVPGRARCRACGNCYALHDWLGDCPECGGQNRDIEGGDEVLIEQMEAC